MTLEITSKIKLNNGVEIPQLGFGTYQIPQGDETKQSVLWALKAGYIHIDTAAYYGNEQSVGEAIRESGISREKIFVTTKLKNDDHGYEKALKAFDKSFENLGLDYIDLYLIHWPVQKLKLDSWRALEEILKSGRCKAIGVSNFTIKHLEELIENSSIIPAVNQVEFSPYLNQKTLLKFCRSKEIYIEAYSPLTRGKKLNDPLLIEISSKYSKTPAQILVRWALQKEIIVLPKSTHEERIQENSNVFDFEISEEDMKKLNSMDENFRVCWNPETMNEDFGE
ncbi:MAG: aldo/keto reductase [Candidatus Aenigmatarchaeota archaeon]